ncbi:ABC transporter ATP-binding protein [Amygdalobacter nucleatus]|uniref:ABC transporter ATP-binding protein n=1 Tax=Amygdalobacter nucleatus TaxID=3029274 RepID=UPI00279F8F83|nr:ABC transporter ATP-binding protein [Amygdalobacter nucleatus]WEG37156.1 ABC transporter ATP-binding protein [Amygdalobacter nucleatus]
MIQLDKISVSYGEQKVFENLSLTIENNEFVAIVGKSGSGKTTLLNIIGLLEFPHSGQVLIDGEKYTSAHKRLLYHRSQVSFLFQNYALVDDLSVKENLEIACKYSSVKKANKTSRQEEDEDAYLKQVLAKVELPENVLNKKIFQLSGGEQQRVALARLLLKDAKYILADEPTGNLDIANRDIVFAILRRLNKQGNTIVLVTHDLDIARKADRIINLDDY